MLAPADDGPHRPQRRTRHPAKEQDHCRAGRDLGARHWFVGGTKLAEHVPTPITATVTGTSSLTAVIATVDINPPCPALMSSAGTILTPTIGGMGTASGATLVLTGATVDATAEKCSRSRDEGLARTGGYRRDEASRTQNCPAARRDPSTESTQ
jgi:hypothetical protein